jgi:predicted alpha/beta-hydrolase family hydrolase
MFVFGHGAGAGMDHPFMKLIAARLGARGVGTLRYQFPYMEMGRHRPDPPALLERTARVAVIAAREHAPDLFLCAGGKSMGGRITSQTAAQEPLPGVRALLFFGFPLHPPGRRDTRRDDHLRTLDLPLLFLQGTRDKLAELALMRRLCAELGPRATLHVVEGADHGFAVPRRSGYTTDQVLDELADTASTWLEALARRAP